MNTRNLLFILPFLLLAGSVFGQKKKPKKKKKVSIANQIENFIEESGSSSKLSSGNLSIMLIDSSGGKTISRVSHYGKPGSADSPIFELGDLTQIFTSLLVYELAEAGRLDITTSINNLLPEALQSIHFQNITIPDCLSHRTGLPRLPNNIGSKQIDHQQPFEFYQRSDLATFISTWAPHSSTIKYQYSLIGYELVGIILEHQLQKTFGALISDYLNPIYGFESLTAAPLKPSRKGKNRVGNIVQPMRFASFMASSGLKANETDLKRLLLESRCNSRPAFYKAMEIRQPTNIDPSTSIASGWHHYQVNKHHSFYLQKGSTKGFSAFIAYYPITRTGVILLSSQKVELGPMGYYIMGKLNNGWKK